MLTDATKTKLAVVLALTGVGLGALACLAELFNVPRQEAGLAFAERGVIFLFGAVHLVVAAIITVFRRTAT